MSLGVENLSVRKGRKDILSGVSFTAPKGAITGLIGPNGAGKSTLLTALLGLVPSRGSACFEGNELPAMPRRDRARLAAFVEQSANTEERLSVREIVALGRIPHQSAFAPRGGADDNAIIAAALAETGMTDFTSRRFDTLSGGATGPAIAIGRWHKNHACSCSMSQPAISISAPNCNCWPCCAAALPAE
jgi:iron complex transport system ATP-binding protein